MAEIMDRIHRFDSLINYRLADLRARRWLTMMMVFASKLGDGPGWAALGAAILAFGGERGRLAVLMAAAVAALSIIIFKALKGATSRKRPFETYPDLVMILPPPDMFSFPSGHSMSAFAITAVIGHYFPPLLAPLAALSTLIAASRVFLALHYPTDCLAGAVIGSVVALTLVFLAG